MYWPRDGQVRKERWDHKVRGECAGGKGNETGGQNTGGAP